LYAKRSLPTTFTDIMGLEVFRFLTMPSTRHNFTHLTQ